MTRLRVLGRGTTLFTRGSEHEACKLGLPHILPAACDGPNCPEHVWPANVCLLLIMPSASDRASRANGAPTSRSLGTWPPCGYYGRSDRGGSSATCRQGICVFDERASDNRSPELWWHDAAVHPVHRVKKGASVKSVKEGGSLETWLVRVSGRVQGIGYREACIHRARALGITGWVRNRMDESVEAMLQGSPAVLAEMRDWMSDGYVAALVGDIQVTAVEAPFPRFNRFELLSTL